MKQKNTFQQNISKLIKTTNDSQLPSDAFTEELIARSLEQLNPNTRTFPFKTIAACAAVFLATTALTIKLAILPETPPAGNQQVVQKTTPLAPTKPTTNAVAIEPEPANKLIAVAPGPTDTDLAPLPFTFPKPMFVGTPTNIKVSRLEKPRGRPRPPFYAPKGTKNIALNKPVTGTDSNPIIGELQMITDGDKSAADGSYVEMGPFGQHVTVDLQAECEIYAILFWHYHKQARVYFDVVVQISSDPDFINAKTIYNNDHDNSSGLGVGNDLHYVETNEGRLVDAKGARARYVRIHSNGSNANDLNNFIEIEVWGRPLATNDKQSETSKENKNSQPNVEALPIELPKPMFVGTPTNIKVHRLEGPRRSLSPITFHPAPVQRTPVRSTPVQPPHYPMAHGGSTPPNAEAYDAALGAFRDRVSEAFWEELKRAGDARGVVWRNQNL